MRLCIDTKTFSSFIVFNVRLNPTILNGNAYQESNNQI